MFPNFGFYPPPRTGQLLFFFFPFFLLFPCPSSFVQPPPVEIDISIYFSMVYEELRVSLGIGSRPGMTKFVTLYAPTCHSLTPIRRSLGSQDKNRKPIRRTDGFPLIQIRTGLERQVGRGGAGRGSRSNRRRRRSYRGRPRNAVRRAAVILQARGRSKRCGKDHEIRIHRGWRHHDSIGEVLICVTLAGARTAAQDAVDQAGVGGRGHAW